METDRKGSMCVLLFLASVISSLLILATPGRLNAEDDRALFRATNAKPNVFFIIDISSSMHRDLESDRTPMSGEDPSSRLYLAKRAAYEVIEEIGDSIHYGWATFNRQDMVVRRKHFLYRAQAVPSFHGELPIFQTNKPVIFGEPRHRRNILVANNTNAAGDATDIDDTNKIYRYRYCDDETGSGDRMLDFPKLGHAGDYKTELFYERSGTDYRLTFLPLEPGEKMGAPEMKVRVRVEERTDVCSAPDPYTQKYLETVTFVRFFTDDQDPTDPLPFAPFTGYIGFNLSGNVTSGYAMDDYEVTSACNAAPLANPSDPDDGRRFRWDGNFDGDLGAGDPATYDVQADALGRGNALARGDMIPWDWKPADLAGFTTTPREEILLRLAPNLILPGETVPDFRVARYFEDVPTGTPTNSSLQLKADFIGRPPIMAAEGTPIAGALESFKGWYQDWLVPASAPVTGDAALQCRKKFVILLTDGAESCEGGSLFDPASNKRTKPCEIAKELYGTNIEPDVKTFVVAFGASAEEVSTLECVADEGGSGAGVDVDDDGVIDNPGIDKNGDGEPDGPGPITANNKDELVKALLKIFELVKPESSAISAAAVPSVQADVADKVYLTEFTPIDAGSVWPGRLQSFVKPLPFTADGLPDSNRKCDSTRTSGCLAWEAQDVVVKNQVKGTESDPVGFLNNQRRVFYSKLRADDGSVQSAADERVPRQRRFLEAIDVPAPPATTPPAAYDLWHGLGLDFTIGDSVSEAAAEDVAGKAVSKTLALKEATLPDGRKQEFVVGDFFHSDPLVVNAPSNTTYFLQDLEGDLSKSCEDGDPKSYRCFALLHENRRKILYLGSNAGMLHAFDAGNYQLPPSPELVHLGEFDNGTGRELFAYVPRPVMPTLVEMGVTDTNRHKYTVDGPPIASDVFIDPYHGGADSTTDAPSATDRVWRTVLMGGLRRGGSRMGDRLYSFGDILDPDVVKPDPIDPDLDTDIQLTSGYYLLDITQPDRIETDLIAGGRNDRDGDSKVDVWVPKGVTDPTAPPACLVSGDADGGGTGPTDCNPLADPSAEPVAYGAPLWEFLDLMIGGKTAANEAFPPLRLDEDDNGYVDLGFSWSKPVIGRLRVCPALLCNPSDERDLYVAVFGGGWDPLHPDARGNFLYMVDIETGRAIYKEKVEGSVTARPVVVPTSDGYIDRIYVGTTRGFLYRLDMRPRLLGNLFLPRLLDKVVSERAADPNDSFIIKTVDKTVKRILTLGVAGSPKLFEPIKLFDAKDAGDTFIRPIFLAASAFFVADLGQYGVAFGTGNRDDLFREDDIPGRFVVFVDELTDTDLRDPSFVPLTSADFEQISSVDRSGTNLLLDEPQGQRGWYLDLLEDERVISEPLVLSGLLFFSTFRPLTSELVADASNILCSAAGLGRVYGMLVTNGEGVLADEDGNPARNITVKGLITAPYAEQSQTKNPAVQSTGDPDEITPELEALMEELRGLFPATCNFPPGFRLDIKVRNQDTGLTFVIPVPICVIESAFREF